MIRLSTITRTPVRVASRAPGAETWSLECSVRDWNAVRMHVRAGEMAAEEAVAGPVVVYLVRRV